MANGWVTLVGGEDGGYSFRVRKAQNVITVMGSYGTSVYRRNPADRDKFVFCGVEPFGKKIDNRMLGEENGV